METDKTETDEIDEDSLNDTSIDEMIPKHLADTSRSTTRNYRDTPNPCESPDNLHRIAGRNQET